MNNEQKPWKCEKEQMRKRKEKKREGERNLFLLEIKSYDAIGEIIQRYDL